MIATSLSFKLSDLSNSLTGLEVSVNLYKFLKTQIFYSNNKFAAVRKIYIVFCKLLVPWEKKIRSFLNALGV